MGEIIKNFNEFLNEQNTFENEFNESDKYLTEANELEVKEFLAILEAVGSLQGLPPKWMKILANKYDNLGGENSIRTTVPVKATQKKKIFGYFKDGYEGTPVLALMGFTEGQPAFMIYKDRFSWSSKAGKWKLMIGEEVYDRKIRKGAYSGGDYNSWTEVKGAFGQKDIMETLPDGEFDMQLITVDPNRMKLRRERSEIAAAAGIKSLNGIQKSTVYKVILGKVKPQIDSIVTKISTEIKENITGVINDIFNPEIKYPASITDDALISLERLKEITNKLKDARHTIDTVFPGKGNVSPETLFNKSKSDWSWDTEAIDKLKDLIKNGITL
jgi:hypothetical protein